MDLINALKEAEIRSLLKHRHFLDVGTSYNGGLADEGCLAATMVCKCRRRPLRNGRWPASNQRKALICGRILDPPPYLFTEPAPPMLYFSELHIAGFHKLQNSHPLQTNSARCPALGPQQRQSQLQCRFLANRRD